MGIEHPNPTVFGVDNLNKIDQNILDILSTLWEGYGKGKDLRPWTGTETIKFVEQIISLLQERQMVLYKTEDPNIPTLFVEILNTLKLRGPISVDGGMLKQLKNIIDGSINM